MLVDLTVKNYKSFKDEHTFSLMAGTGGELLDSHVFNTSTDGNGLNLLSTSAIYGANASGKSNLIQAFSAMCEIVSESATESKAGDLLPVEPYLFCENSSELPTEFETTFFLDEVKYQYGFSATKHRVLEEWLIAFPKGRAQRWFERACSTKSGEEFYKFSDYFTGQKTLWKKATRSNALFLSTAVHLNCEQLEPLYLWFRDNVRFVGPNGLGATFSAHFCEESEEQKRKIMSLIKTADIEIEDIRVRFEKLNPAEFLDNVSQVVKDELEGSFSKFKVPKIDFGHKTDDGGVVYLPLEEESDGTNRLFSFAAPWLDALENGYVLFVDELNNSFHPKIVEFLILLFNDKTFNRSGAQLIFSTHETSILSLKTSRRDQVWFVDKKGNKSNLYSLLEFKPRKNRENFEANYLDGKYGGLPFIVKDYFEEDYGI